MYRLGLTGSIATGKSTVLQAFAALGYSVFSADEAVHILYQGRAVDPISKAFPEAVVNGHIDRTILSQTLMSAPHRMTELNDIVHPLVRTEMQIFLRQAEENGAELAIIDIPLLYETGVDYGLDGVAVTFCDDDAQRQRALARENMSAEKLEVILAHQLSQSEKKLRAEFLIDTNKTLAETKTQVVEIAAVCVAQKLLQTH